MREAIMNTKQNYDPHRKWEPRTPPKSGEAVRTSAMIASLSAEGYDAVSAPFGHALVAEAKRNDRIVGLTADLAKYTDLHVFAEAFPDRFYQMGMAEQVMISAAAGLAREGFVPFATTYAVFASRRAYDFIAMAIAEENLPVKIVCALPGLTTGYGPSHQATEDLAIFRGLPNLTIIDPCDAIDVAEAVPAMVAHDGPVYMRLLRGKVPSVIRQHCPDYTFEIGKAKLLRDGTDALVISSGFMTMRALDAAVEMEKDGLSVGVLHSPTIKPLDTATILAEAGKGGRLIVTAENHSRVGGLGEAVATTLLVNGVTPTFRMIGLPDQFLDAGALPSLHDRYGISTAAMIRQIRGWL
jgi:transketolase